MEDGSLVAVGGVELIVSTDSYAVFPPIFPGANIGALAVTGTVNDITASGGRAVCLTLALVISEGFLLEDLRTILDSVRLTAENAGVQVVAGDTKVLPQARTAEILVTTTGIGVPVVPGCDYGVSRARPGDVVLVTGTIGDHELAVLSAREGLGFERKVLSDCALLNHLLVPLLETEPGIRCLRDPTRGGLAGVLLDIAEASAVEICLDEKAVPIRPEVRFGCEMLGLNPLFLVNEGKMVIVTDATCAESVLERLRGHPLGSCSARIGEVRGSDRGGRVLLGDVGGKRIVTRPEGHPQPRLC